MTEFDRNLFAALAAQDEIGWDNQGGDGGLFSSFQERNRYSLAPEGIQYDAGLQQYTRPVELPAPKILTARAGGSIGALQAPAPDLYIADVNTPMGFQPAPTPKTTLDTQQVPFAVGENGLVEPGLPEVKPQDVPILGGLASWLSPADPTRAPIVGGFAKAISDITRPTSGPKLFDALAQAQGILGEMFGNLLTDADSQEKQYSQFAKELGAPDAVAGPAGAVADTVNQVLGATGATANATLAALMGLGNEARDIPILGGLYRALWEAPMNVLNEATQSSAGGLIAAGNLIGRGITDVAGMYGAAGGIEGLWKPGSRVQEYLAQVGNASRTAARGNPMDVNDYLTGAYLSASPFEQMFTTFVNPINAIDIYPIGALQKARGVARATGKTILPEAKLFGKTIVPRMEITGANAPLVVRMLFDLPEVKRTAEGAVPMLTADKLGIRKSVWWERLMPTELTDKARGYGMLQRSMDNMDTAMMGMDADGLRAYMDSMSRSARSGQMAKEFFDKYPGAASKDAQTAIRLTGAFDTDAVWQVIDGNREAARKALAENTDPKKLPTLWRNAVESVLQNKSLDAETVFNQVAKVELRTAWGKHIATAIKDQLGIKSAGVIQKMMDNVRAWEGALYIGMNPGSWLRNGWDNKKNMVVYGINPRHNYQKIQETYRALGWDPFEQLRHEIKATIAPDAARGAYGASIPQKLQDVLPWYQNMEKADNLRAYWSAFDNAQRLNWVRGNWFKRMPRGLEKALDGISPHLSNIVYGAIEAGRSPAQVLDNLNNIFNQIHVEAFVDDPDFLRDIGAALGATGALDEKTARLILAPHADGINEAIGRAFKRADVPREQALAEELSAYLNELVSHHETLRTAEAPEMRKAAQQGATQSDPDYQRLVEKARAAEPKPPKPAAPAPVEPDIAPIVPEVYRVPDDLRASEYANIADDKLPQSAEELAYDETRRQLETTNKYDKNRPIRKIEKDHPEWKAAYEERWGDAAVPAPTPKAEPPQADTAAAPVSASVPVMITKDMRQQLADLGYSRAEIDAMKPQDANDIFTAGTTKPRVSSAPAQGVEPPLSESEQTMPEWIRVNAENAFNRLTPAQRTQIEVLAAQRRTAQEIADAIGVDRDTVIYARSKMGIPSQSIGVGLSQQPNPDFEKWLQSRQIGTAQVAARAAPTTKTFSSWQEAFDYAAGDKQPNQAQYERIREVFDARRAETLAKPKKGAEEKLAQSLYDRTEQFEKEHPEWKAAYNKRVLDDPEFANGLHIGDRVEWVGENRQGLITNTVELGMATALPSEGGAVGFVAFGQPQFDTSKVHVNFDNWLDIDVDAKQLRKIGEATTEANAPVSGLGAGSDVAVPIAPEVTVPPPTTPIQRGERVIYDGKEYVVSNVSRDGVLSIKEVTARAPDGDARRMLLGIKENKVTRVEPQPNVPALGNEIISDVERSQGDATPTVTESAVAPLAPETTQVATTPAHFEIGPAERLFADLRSQIDQVKADAVEWYPPTIRDWNARYHAAKNTDPTFSQRAINKMTPERLQAYGLKLAQKIAKETPELAQTLVRDVQDKAQFVWHKIVNGDYKKLDDEVEQKMFARVRDGDRIVRALTNDAQGLDLTGLRGYTEVSPNVAEGFVNGPERATLEAGRGEIPATEPTAEVSGTEADKPAWQLPANAGGTDFGLGGRAATDEGVSTGAGAPSGDTGISQAANISETTPAPSGAAIANAEPATEFIKGDRVLFNGREYRVTGQRSDGRYNLISQEPGVSAELGIRPDELSPVNVSEVPNATTVEPIQQGVESSATRSGAVVEGQRPSDSITDVGSGPVENVAPDSGANNQPVQPTATAGNERNVGVGTSQRRARTVPATPDGEPVAGTARSDHSDAGGRDYVITESDAIGAGGEKIKFRQNVRAIELVTELEGGKRFATPEEQAELVKYVGWGGLSNKGFFNPREEAQFRQMLADRGREYTENYIQRWDADWGKEKLQLLEALNPEDYAQARASTLNAHYTSPVVIKSMWEAIRRLGWDGGKMLEPAVGVGHFFGLMPTDLAARTARVGVDKDALSARIAKQLYQRSNVMHAGFEEVKFPDNYFSLGVSNIPFGNILINDPRYNSQRFLLSAIHDYYFAKMLDKTEPGGIVAFITSHFTMDKQDARVRSYIADRADLVGMIRLPNNAFKGNAGTEVVTDIVFLRKRLPDEPARGEPFRNLGEVNGFSINEYYQRHPEMMLGEWTDKGSMYGKNEMTLTPIEGSDLAAQLKEAVANLPEGVYDSSGVSRYDLATAEQFDTAMQAARTGRMTQMKVEKGKAVVIGNGTRTVIEATPKELARIKAFDELRLQWRETLETWRKPETSDTEAAAALQRLNDKYNAFTKDFGYINSRTNNSFFRRDDDLPNLRALENPVEGTKNEFERADALLKRTIFPPEQRTYKIETAQDALVTVLNENGRVDLKRMAELANKPVDALKEELRGRIFRNPDGDWETADAYLSGNVREKLRAAESAAQIDEAFAENATALRNILPADLPPEKIEVDLGAPWMGGEPIRQFMAEMTGNPTRSIRVEFQDPIALWKFDTPGYFQDASKQADWNTDRYSFYDAVNDAANHRSPTIFDTRRDANGDTVKVVNTEQTTAARALLDKVKREYATWVWRDENRAAQIARAYNDKFNGFVERKYDGAHLTFPGMSPVWRGRMYPHQKNGIWRALSSSGNTLLSHSVGSGKSLQLAAIVMEAKRLGIAKKSVLLTEKNLVSQLGGQIREIYPGARVLMATEKDFETANRRAFMARIANGDWDAIVMSHSQFNMLPVSPETYNNFVGDEISRAVRFVETAKAERGKGDASIKEIEKHIENLRTRMENYAKSYKKDVNINFEEMGIDQVVVDESHNFKRLWFQTKMGRVRGVQPDGSERAFNLYIKLRHLNQQNNGRGIVFATGTPLSNTLAEVYTLQRFLAPQQLEELGIDHFDAWAHTFGKLGQYVEPTPDGTRLKVITAFRQFQNVRQLSGLFRQFADVILTKDLIAADVLKNMPKLENDAHIIIKTQPTSEFTTFQQRLLKMMQEFEAHPTRETRHIPLWVLTKGNLASVDMRLIDNLFDNNPGSKLNVAARQVYDVWKETHAEGKTQLVFINVGVPGGSTPFNTYEHMRKTLVELGIPANEVEFRVLAAGSSQKALDEMMAQAERVKSGKTKVLIGSYPSMGQGLNVQERLFAVHHIDVPWRPDQIEQADGRIIRQGNTNPRVRVYRYVTERSTDMNRWTKIEQKSRMVEQFLKGDLDANVMDDPGAISSESAAEIAAAASGNPMLVERALISSEAQNLEMQARAHVERTRKARFELATLPQTIDAKQKDLEFMQAAIDAVAPAAKAKDFKILVGGTEYVEKEAAGAEVLRLANAFKDSGVDLPTLRQGHPIGVYRGVEMFATVGIDANKIYPVVRFVFDGQELAMADASGESAAGMITRLNNALDGLDGRADKLAEQIGYYQNQLIAQQKISSSAFEYQQRLDAIRARIAEIDKAMNPDDKLNKAMDALSDEGEDAALVDAGFEGLTVADELNEALPHESATGMTLDAGEPRFTDDMARLNYESAQGWRKKYWESDDMPGASGPNMADATAAEIETLQKLMPVIQQQVLDAALRQPVVLDPVTARALMEYTQNVVSPAFQDATAAANVIGKWNQQRTLLDYDKRTNFDEWLSYGFPFLYWRRAQAWNWFLRILEKPNLWNGYVKAQQMLDDMTNSDEYPARLRGKLRLPMPGLEAWMGGNVFFNPLELFMPIEALYGTEINQAKYGGATGALLGLPASNEDIARILRSQARNGQIPRADAENAIAARQGDLWEAAKQLAQQDTASPDNLTSLFTPHAPLQWLIAALTDQTDSIGPLLPISRPIRQLTGAMGINNGEGINIESPVRNILRAVGLTNLPEFDPWEEYRVVRQLANMVADGDLDEKSARLAMMQKSGDAWAEAYRRANAEKLPLAGMIAPMQIFPTGEQDIRDAQVYYRGLREQELRRLGADPLQMTYDEEQAFLKGKGAWGDGMPLREFLDNHPELEARSAMFQSQEERVKRWMIEGMWEKYNSLSALDKRGVRAQMPEEWNTYFLNSDTRDYANLDLLDVIQWGQRFDVLVPNVPTGEIETLDAARYLRPETLQYADPQTAQAYQDFTQAMDAQFDSRAMWQLGDEYKALTDTNEKRDFLQAHPDYAAFKTAWAKFYEANPDVKEFLIGVGAMSADTATAQQSKGQIFYNMVKAAGLDWDKIQDKKEKYYDLPQGTGARTDYLNKNGDLLRYFQLSRAFYGTDDEAVQQNLKNFKPNATKPLKQYNPQDYIQEVRLPKPHRRPRYSTPQYGSDEMYAALAAARYAAARAGRAEPRDKGLDFTPLQ